MKYQKLLVCLCIVAVLLSAACLFKASRLAGTASSDDGISIKDSRGSVAVVFDGLALPIPPTLSSVPFMVAKTLSEKRPEIQFLARTPELPPGSYVVPFTVEPIRFDAAQTIEEWVRADRTKEGLSFVNPDGIAKSINTSGMNIVAVPTDNESGGGYYVILYAEMGPDKPAFAIFIRDERYVQRMLDDAHRI